MASCGHCWIFHALFLLFFSLSILIFVGIIIIRLWLQRCHRLTHSKSDKGPMEKSIGFFHPYCNAGGGGERVLWCAIRAVQKEFPDFRCIVYTGDENVTSDVILKNAERNFNISFEKPVEFIFLTNRHLVEDKKYPYLTLLGQSIGSILLALEAIFKFVPTVYFDTMGYAFTFPVFKYLGKCKIGCYVHYPTISVDMLNQVVQRKTSFNNPSYITKNVLLSKAKLIYYRLFAKLYSMSGRSADLVLVNSSWTEGHINQLWRKIEQTHKVYPPCDVSTFEKIPLESSSSKVVKIISVAQFRPEKGHEIQIEAFKELLNLLPVERHKTIRFLIVGGCRNEDDETRVKTLQQLAKSLHVEEFINFKLNVTFETLQELLQEATIGLHTMKNEHFGIGIVECMAAGVVIIANDSGGPKLDIVTEYQSKKTGFLASSVDEYAQQMLKVVNASPEELLKIRTNARASVQRFSDSKFDFQFLKAVQQLLKKK